MKKFLLVSLLMIATTNFSKAQENADDPSNPMCKPFKEAITILKDQGYAPIFMSFDPEKSGLILYKTEKDIWVILRLFHTNTAGDVACMMAKGPSGIVIPEVHQPKTEEN